MANFNDQYLRGLKAKDKPYRTMDTGKGAVDALGVQVTTGGRKNWFIRYRDPRGSRRFHKIGTYPELAIAKAREKGRTLLGQIQAGDLDPKQRNDSPAATFGDLVDDYRESCITRGVKSMHTIKSYLNAIPDSILRTAANEITPADIHSMVRPMALRAPVRANQFRQQLSTIFQYGLAQDYNLERERTLSYRLEANPVRVVPKIKGVNKPSSVVVTSEIVKLAWNICHEYNSIITPLALQFHIAMGGIRTMESTERRWDEIQVVQGVECLVIPAESTKMGREHVVPVGRRAKVILEQVREYTGHKEVMFPKRGAEKTPIQYAALGHMTRRLKKNHPGLGQFAPRYMRRFAKSALGDRGVSRHSLDLFHAHALPGSAVSTKHYDRSVRLNEKLEVINAWDDYLDELLGADS